MPVPRSFSHRRAIAAIALAGAGALGLAACSSSPTSPSSAAKVSTTTSGGGGGNASTTSAPAASPLHATVPIPAADLSPVGTAGQAPTVKVPTSAPPTNLESADLIVGTGKEAAAGDQVTVQYVLATYSAGKVIQSSWTGQPFSFVLGEGQVIPGWDKGVVGMRVGGRRELIIPPSLGYGATPPQGAQGIAANDTLVFMIDLLNVS